MPSTCVRQSAIVDPSSARHGGVADTIGCGIVVVWKAMIITVCGLSCVAIPRALDNWTNYTPCVRECTKGSTRVWNNTEFSFYQPQIDFTNFIINFNADVSTAGLQSSSGQTANYETIVV